MDLRGLLDPAVEVLRGLSPRQILEIGTGTVGFILIIMKTYQYGKTKWLKKVRRLFLGEEGFWNKRPTRNIARHISMLDQGIPILTIVNFKGGVGKSTVAANLAAFFDSRGLRVLIIDFDYQGSLTELLVQAGADPPGAVDIINPKKSPTEVLTRIASPIEQLKSTGVLTSTYVLNRMESLVAFRWLIGEETTDIRYVTHRTLSSPDVRNKYDLVIIDAPPRLTTATVNAICASTHILVPTTLGRLSTTATLTTIDTLIKLRDILSPKLKIIGVLPTFVVQSTGYTAQERQELNHLANEIANRFGDKQLPPIQILENEPILRKMAFVKLIGVQLPFFEDDQIKDMFAKLGHKVAESFDNIDNKFIGKLDDASEKVERRASDASTNVVELGL